MKKIATTLGILLMLLTACSLGDAAAGEGYILEIDGGRVLVLDQPYVGKTWNELFEQYQGSAIWLTTAKKDLEPGQKIQYWVKGGINDSYPGQAQAEKIKVISE